MGRYKNWRGVIDKPILELLTFESNMDFSGFGVDGASRVAQKNNFWLFFAVFPYMWPLARPNIVEKGWPGGCASG